MTVVPSPIHEQPVAKSHLAPALVELASGVDALYLSGRANLPEALLAALEDHRALAEAGSVPVAFDLGGESYSLSPRLAEPASIRRLRPADEPHNRP